MGTRTLYYDDLEPTKEASVIGLNFNVDGLDYEIDLSADNAAILQSALAPFIDKARKVGGRGSNVRQIRRSAATPVPPRHTGTKAAADPVQTKAMREWGRQHGFKVNQRGAIPADLREAYHNRDPETGAPAANEVAARVNGAVAATALASAGVQPYNARDMDEFKGLFRPWAESRGYKINKNGLSAPPVVKRFSEETGVYQPNATLPKAG